jgi:hypothetical protein
MIENVTQLVVGIAVPAVFALAGPLILRVTRRKRKGRRVRSANRNRMPPSAPVEVAAQRPASAAEAKPKPVRPPSQPTPAELVAEKVEQTPSTDPIRAMADTVDQMAFQTRLTALDAAIDASRGGAQGRNTTLVPRELAGLAHARAKAEPPKPGN